MLHWFAKRLARTGKDVRKDERGFTLIELLVVVIIIGILAAIAIPTFLAQREGAWERTAQSDVRNAASAATACSSDNDGSYSNCAVANLGPYGFNSSADVDVNGSNVSASGFTASMQHTEGGSAYTFTTADGQVTEAARDAGAPAAP